MAKKTVKGIGKDLEKALSRNDLAAIADIVASRGPNVYVLPEERHTLMHDACALGLTDLVNLLIGKGADVNVQNTAGATPLHMACFNDRPDTVRFLMEHGADMYIEDLNEMTPFDDIYKSKGDGFTAVQEEIAGILLEHGYDAGPNLLDACVPWRRRPSVVRFLLSRGVDPRVEDMLGNTALDYCIEHDSDETTREEILDLFRKHHPELVMEVYCTQAPGGM